MKHQVKNTLRAMASHIGLKVKFVDYFDDQTHGRLLVREKRILLNAHKPRIEHFFTILHEIGHYMVHHLTPRRTHHPRFFDVNLINDLIPDLCRFIRRYFRFIFNTREGLEWEADLWAMCAFLILANRIGCRADLVNFLDRHPEKMPTFLLVAGAVAYTNAKTRVINYSKRLLLPFKSA